MKFFRVLIAVLTVTFIAADAMAITNAQKMQMHKERQKSKNQDCENSLYKLNSILRTYAAKNKGFLPNKNNFAGLKSLIAYGAKIEHFSCKAARTKKAKDLTRLSEESNPYLYFGGINLTQAAKSCPKLVVCHVHAAGVNGAFLDCLVQELQHKRHLGGRFGGQLAFFKSPPSLLLRALRGEKKALLLLLYHVGDDGPTMG